MIELGPYIKTRPDITGAGLARSVGITEAYLYRLIGGTANPSPNVLTRLAEALGVEAVHLRHDGTVWVDA